MIKIFSTFLNDLADELKLRIDIFKDIDVPQAIPTKNGKDFLIILYEEILWRKSNYDQIIQNANDGSNYKILVEFLNHLVKQTNSIINRTKLGFSNANEKKVFYFLDEKIKKIKLEIAQWEYLKFNEHIEELKIRNFNKTCNEEDFESINNKKSNRVSSVLDSSGFEIIKKGINEGRFGSISYAKKGEMEVALKFPILKFLKKKNETNINSIKNEIVFLEKIHHNNIVKFIGHYHITDVPVIVLKYYPLGSLKDFLNKDKKLLCKVQQKKLALDIINGIGYLHQNAIIHRDIKNNNILIEQIGENYYNARLSDLGSARFKKELSEIILPPIPDSTWAAPEIQKLSPKYSKKSDIYAYGSVLFQLATKKTPRRMENLPKEISGVMQFLIEQCRLSDPKRRPTAEIVKHLLKDTYGILIEAIENKPSGDNNEKETTSTIGSSCCEINKINAKDLYELKEIFDTSNVRVNLAICSINKNDCYDFVAVKKVKFSETLVEIANKKESYVLQKLFHPCLLHSSVEVTDEEKWIVSPYMENGDLNGKKKIFPSERRLQISYDITDALKFLHSHDIIHRDIKSQNVFLDRKWRAKLADFGIVRIPNKQGGITYLNIKHPIGTEGYIPPEIKKWISSSEEPNPPYSEKADNFALGVLFWEIAYRTDALSARKNNFKKPDLAESVPEKYQELIEKCTDTDPENRPKTSEILEKLEKIREVNSSSPRKHHYNAFKQTAESFLLAEKKKFNERKYDSLYKQRKVIGRILFFAFKDKIQPNDEISNILEKPIKEGGFNYNYRRD